MARMIQRYVRKEIFLPFVFALSVFSVALFMQNALELSDMIITRGVGPSNFMRIVLYTLPSILWLSMPMAFLMATLTGLGRLSSDNEILAMRALGIGTINFLKPVLTLSVLLCGLTFAIGSLGVPWGRSSLNILIYRILQESATAGLQPMAFNDRFTDLIIYAERVEPKSHVLEKIIMADYRGEVPETIMARKGSILTDPNTFVNTLTLLNGSVHHYEPKLGRYRLIHFDEYSLSLSTDEASAERLTEMSKKDPSEMTFSELKRASRKGDPEERRIFRMHYHEKFSLPFACVVFGLVSVPLGIRFRRSGKVVGFSWSLLVVFLYYVLLGLGRNLGSEGVIPPQLAPWAPNLILGFLGIYLIFQTSRKLPPERRTLRRRTQQWFRGLLSPRKKK